MPYEITNKTGSKHSVGLYGFKEGVCYADALPPEVLINLESNAPLISYKEIDVIPAIEVQATPSAPSNLTTNEATEFDDIQLMQWKQACDYVAASEDQELMQALINLDKRPSVKSAAADRLAALLEAATVTSPVEDHVNDAAKESDTQPTVNG